MINSARLWVLIFLQATLALAGQFRLTLDRDETLLNGHPIQLLGLRCSNALISQESTDRLIGQLDTLALYGINSFSVYFMGSRFGDVKGYHANATLDSSYTERMAQIIHAADQRGMVVLVGCLYWGTSKAKYPEWTQKEANTAVANTVKWLSENDFTNCFVDPDNEGMAHRAMGFDIRAMIRAGKSVDSTILIAANYDAETPPEADLGIHFCKPVEDKPYIETEATPKNAPGGYWGSYSKRPELYNYINIGIYTEDMKNNQIRQTREHLDNGHGYFFSSTWLQCVPPEGPNYHPGGNGSLDQPGYLWWLQFVQSFVGPYRAPK